MTRKQNKKIVIVDRNQNMPLVTPLIMVLLVIFLLSMIFYFISGALGNFAGLRETSLTTEEETREFAAPLFQNDSQQIRITGNPSNTDSTSQQRFNTNTSNTSTTRTDTTRDQTNTTQPTNDNGNFIQETIDTTTNTVNETIVAPTGILQPVITQAAGLLDNLIGN